MKINGRVLVAMCGFSLMLAVAETAKAQTLSASASLDQSGLTSWNYTLINTEPAGSNNWLTDFFLPIHAPVTNVQTANGWQIETDNASFIEWSNLEDYPYPSDIAPGDSVSGFSFTSVATGSPVQYTLASWDHSADTAGPNATGTVLAPYAPAAVPEAGTWQSLGIPLFLGGLLMLRRSRQRRSANGSASVNRFGLISIRGNNVVATRRRGRPL